MEWGEAGKCSHGKGGGVRDVLSAAIRRRGAPWAKCWQQVFLWAACFFTGWPVARDPWVYGAPPAPRAPPASSLLPARPQPDPLTAPPPSLHYA